MDKGLDDAAEVDQSSGRKGDVLPCSGLPTLAGRKGTWRGVLADQEGTRKSVSRRSINLVPFSCIVRPAARYPLISR